MKLQYLGTAASEGWPAVFCQCEPCRAARRLGGKNIRRRTSAVVDGRLLIDLSPDVYSQTLNYGIDLSEVKHFLVTHSHEDHFYAHELANIAEPFSYNCYGIPVTLYGSCTVLETARPHLEPESIAGRLQLVEVCAYRPFTAGGYEVTPLPANHSAGVSFNYLIAHEGKTLLYAHDTGWLLDEVWDFLRGKRLDLVSMDGTCGVKAPYVYHMTFDENIRMKQKLVSIGAADAATTFVSAHFSHNGGLLHHEIEEKLSPHGILTAYDGMEIIF